MSTPAFPSVAATTTSEAGALPCCGGPPAADASACCARDEARKAAGKAGCGCAAVAAHVATTEPAEAQSVGGCCVAIAKQPGTLSHR